MKKDSVIYVAGHTGLVGSAITRHLMKERYNHIVIKDHESLDLKDKQSVKMFFQIYKPEYVFLAAARVGGILANDGYRAEFIYENDIAYAAADLIVSRAGANSITEIIAAGKPAILVPLPSAAEDHQTKNAQTLAEANAGVLIPEPEAEEKLAKTILELIKNEKERSAIVKNLKQFEHGDATLKIVGEVIKLIEKKKN